MMASGWTDEDSRAAAERIIKRAEISKVLSTVPVPKLAVVEHRAILFRVYQVASIHLSPPSLCSFFIFDVLDGNTDGQITRRLKSRLSLARDKTNHDLMSPSVESLDGHSSMSAASSDSRLPTPTSLGQPYIPAPPLENPFLVPAQAPITTTIPTRIHHRKSQSRSSVHSINGTAGHVKPPMTDLPPKRKRSRTASAAPNQSQYTEFLYPTIPQDTSWRTHRSSPIRPPRVDYSTQSSISHLAPQMLDSPFPANYNTSNRPHSSPPSTPPSAFRRRPLSGSGEEGADLLLFLATSPSPAQPSSRRFTSNAAPPGTPPSMVRKSATADPATPGQSTFDVRDYINITPSPAPPVWNGGTPMTLSTPARRRLTYDDAVVGSPVELGNDGIR